MIANTYKPIDQMKIMVAYELGFTIKARMIGTDNWVDYPKCEGCPHDFGRWTYMCKEFKDCDWIDWMLKQIQQKENELKSAKRMFENLNIIAHPSFADESEKIESMIRVFRKG